MSKTMIRLVKLGIAFLTASIVLDFYLGGYGILLWPALALEFIIFAATIFSSLRENLLPNTKTHAESRPRTETDFARLEDLCSAAIEQTNPKAEGLISDRVRSLAFAAAASNLNIPEPTLRSLAEQDPQLVQTRVKDSQITRVLITKGPLIQQGRVEEIETLIAKIDEWVR